MLTIDVSFGGLVLRWCLGWKPRLQHYLYLTGYWHSVKSLTAEKLPRKHMWNMRPSGIRSLKEFKLCNNMKILFAKGNSEGRPRNEFQKARQWSRICRWSSPYSDLRDFNLDLNPWLSRNFRVFPQPRFSFIARINSGGKEKVITYK